MCPFNGWKPSCGDDSKASWDLKTQVSSRCITWRKVRQAETKDGGGGRLSQSDTAGPGTCGTLIEPAGPNPAPPPKCWHNRTYQTDPHPRLHQARPKQPNPTPSNQTTHPPKKKDLTELNLLNQPPSKIGPNRPPPSKDLTEGSEQNLPNRTLHLSQVNIGSGPHRKARQVNRKCWPPPPHRKRANWTEPPNLTSGSIQAHTGHILSRNALRIDLWCYAIFWDVSTLIHAQPWTLWESHSVHKRRLW